MHHDMGDHMQGHMGMMQAVMSGMSALMFVALVLAALYVLDRRGVLAAVRHRALGRRPAALTGRSVPQQGDAEAFLDMALAKGEIDVNDYHERRSALRSQY